MDIFREIRKFIDFCQKQMAAAALKNKEGK